MPSSAYRFLRWFYFWLPLKLQCFSVVRRIIAPSFRIARYLKFQGVISVPIGTGVYRFHNQNNAIETLLFWRGLDSHEPTSMRAWARVARTSRVIFDVGANTGLFSVVATEYGPDDVQIFGFEPVSRIAEAYRLNMKLNGIENAQCVPAAMSDESGTAILFDMESFDNQIASLVRGHVEMHSHSKPLIERKIATITMDRFVEEKQLDSLSLIKLDVEGVEDLVLLGGRAAIQRFSPVLLIEVSNDRTAAAITTFFDNLPVNYVFFEVQEGVGLLPRTKVAKRSAPNYLICPQASLPMVTDLVV